MIADIFPTIYDNNETTKANLKISVIYCGCRSNIFWNSLSYCPFASDIASADAQPSFIVSPFRKGFEII
jgi:hypothetical protein